MDTTNTLTVDEAKATKSLIAKLKKSNTKYHTIATMGRGGLSLVQRIAYALSINNVDLLELPRDLLHLRGDTLFVDDIVCTGDTISMIPRGVDVAVLVHRKSSTYKPTFAGLVYDGPEYIKFSWEADYGK